MRDGHCPLKPLVVILGLLLTGASDFNEFVPAVSPDGRWLAYVSDESGQDEIYLREFPGLGGKGQISISGGAEPRWRRDSRELFYRIF